MTWKGPTTILRHHRSGDGRRGILINFVNIDPIKALFWAAVLNGIVAVPLMAVIMIHAGARMGKFTLPRPLLGQAVNGSDGRRRRDHVRDFLT